MRIALLMGTSVTLVAQVPFWPIFRTVAEHRAIERAAQVRQESGFNPSAISKAGAQGVAQFMPSTWSWSQDMGWVPPGTSPFTPAAAIQAQHAYMVWLEARVGGDRAAALGSYNAGLRSVRKAQRLAAALGLSGSRAWLEVLPRITGEGNSRETRDYIRRIEGHPISWVAHRGGKVVITSLIA